MPEAIVIEKKSENYSTFLSFVRKYQAQMILLKYFETILISHPRIPSRKLHNYWH